MDLLPPASLLLLSDEPLTAGDRQREPHELPVCLLLLLVPEKRGMCQGAD